MVQEVLRSNRGAPTREMNTRTGRVLYCSSSFCYFDYNVDGNRRSQAVDTHKARVDNWFMAQDEAPVEVDEAAPDARPKRRWWLDPAFIVIVVLVALPFVLIRLTHRPQLEYPPGVAVNQLRIEGPVNPELVAYYEKLYGLDHGGSCMEGKKYATLCQDGELIWDVEEAVCSDHGGVKDWVVCR